MTEGAPIPRMPAKPDKPIPFFQTVDFAKRPKWDVSVSFATELERMMEGVEEGGNENEYLARQMEKTYGKKDAMDILEKVRNHMIESLARSSSKDPRKLHEFVERTKITRGIIGTPNWVDPSKIQEIRFSAK